MKNVIKPLAKNVLIPLGLTAAADPEIHKKILGSGKRSLDLALPHHTSNAASHNDTILIISNDEMEDIIRIVKYLEDSGLLSVKKFKTKLKTKNEDFLACY